MDRHISGILCFVYSIVLCLLLGGVAEVCASESMPSATPDATSLSKPTSLLFVENRGQLVTNEGKPHSDIAFTAASGNVSVLFRSTGISYVFAEKRRAATLSVSADNGHNTTPAETLVSHRVDVEFVHANPATQILPSGQVDEHFNYYYGHCPTGITNVPAFTRLVYKNLYPHIDLVFYNNGSRLKYDFVVHPGGSVADIAMRYTGLEHIPQVHNGALQIRAPLGTIEEEKPYSYLRGDVGQPREVASQFVVKGYTIGFDVPDYDKTKELVIDPGILWGTYIGGSLNDGGLAIATNSQGDIGLVGYTTSHNFPVTGGAFQSTIASVSVDLFFSKFNSNGERLWTTYYGGSGSEYNNGYRIGLACDLSGNFIAVGQTQSSDFPVASAVQGSYYGNGDAFIVMLNGAGQRQWATYCGGTNSDYARDVAVDDNGNIFVVGGTASNNFPTVYPFTNAPAGLNDVFWVKFSSLGVPELARYYGGLSSDEGNAIAVAGDGSLYIAGETGSTSLPEISSGYQTSKSSGLDAFLAKISSAGAVQWSTYYGGNGADVGRGVATDGMGNVVLAGETGSSDMPVSASAQQTSSGGGSDAFLAMFTPAGNRQWATYMGGSGNDKAHIVRVDDADNIVVAGDTRSSNFPLSLLTYQEEYGGITDGFVARFSNDGVRTLATYYGGNGVDECLGMTLYSGYVIIAGNTTSTNLPATIGAFQKRHAGGTDAFLAKLGECSATVQIASSGQTTICRGSSLVLDAGAGYSAYLWSNGATTRMVSIEEAGTYAVTVIGPGGCQATDSLKITVNPVVVSNGDIFLCTGETGVLSAPASSSAGNLRYRWFPDTGLSCTTCPNPTVSVAGATTVYTAVVTDDNGCQSSTTVTVRLRESLAITASVQGDSVVCADEVVSLLATIATATTGKEKYEWWPAAELGCATCPGPLAVAREGLTTYYVKVTSENGCSTIDSVRLFGRPRPVAHAGADTVVCRGTKLQLSGSGGVAYKWEPSDGLDCTTCPNPTVIATQNREYTLTITDAYGCIATDKVMVRIRPDNPLVASAQKVDFGDLDECQSRAIRSVVFSNTSDAVINIDDVLFSNEQLFAFVDAHGLPRSRTLSIAPKSSDTLHFLFMPPTVGRVSAFVTLRGKPCNIDYTLELKGDKKSVAMATNVAQVQFKPLLACDNVWKDTVITVHNAGGKDIVVHASIPAPFLLVDGASIGSEQNLVVKPGNIDTLIVRFQPAADGVFTKGLSLAYESGACRDVVVIGILGERQSPRIQAAAAKVVFPPLLGCQTSVDTTIEVANTGDVPIVITRVDDDDAFSLVTLPPIEIPPHQSRSITMRFKSTTSGSSSKNIVFTGEPCNISVPVTLEGRREGVQFTAPDDTLELPHLVLCRNNSSEVVLPIANISGGNIQGYIQSVVTSGPFSVDMRQGDTIDNGKVRKFSVVFQPTGVGTFVGSAQIVLEPCAVVKTVWFRGTAVDVATEVSSSSVQLGVVPVAGTATKTVIFRNTGTTPTTVDTIAGIAAPFSVTTTPSLPVSLQPQETVLIHIHYTGIQEGKDSTEVVVHATEPCQSQQTIRVQAETTNDKFPIITATGINFGNVVVRSTRTMDIVVRNTGTDIGIITAADFVGTSGVFSKETMPTPPITLQPNESVPLSIKFAPVIPGVQSAQLKIESSAGSTIVDIEGIGIDRFYLLPSLSIPTTLQAHVRDKNVRIPVLLHDAARLAEAQPTNLEVTIQFNRTVFHFVGVAGTGVDSYRYDVKNNDQAVTVYLTKPFTDNAIAFEIVGNMLLGNQDYTDFVIKNVRWGYANREYNILTTTNDGRLAVTGVCRNGGDRLVEEIGEFGISSITPNPSGGRVEITVHTIEHGETYLEVYSIYGKKAFSRKWIPPIDAKTNLVASTETVVLDDQLPSGIYQVVLRSPARRTTAQMIIAK